MITAEHYQGRLGVLGQDVPFYIANTSNSDGSETRELTLDRPPFKPTEFLDLMTSIAPQPEAGGAFGIKTDIAQVMHVTDVIDHDKRLEAIHSHAFGDSWQVITNQARAIFNALPFRDTIFHSITPGEGSLYNLIRQETEPGTTLRKNYLYLNRNNRQDEIAQPLQVAADHSVSLPDTPFVAFNNRSGLRFFAAADRLQKESGELAQREASVTADGVSTVVFNQYSQLLPVWETYRVPNTGISPLIRWTRGADGVLVIEHPDVADMQTEHNGVTWDDSRSSVVGSILLASLTPQVRSEWKRRQGFRPKSRNTQAMGPLQATLLAVRDSNAMLAGRFIQHIETNLAA